MSKYTNMMIDIETLGNVPYSVILSIRAVEFNHKTGRTGREFYCIIDPVSCQKHGLKIEASTVLWWLAQSSEARSEFIGNKVKLDIKTALTHFSKYLSKCDKKVNIWANSPSFDCARIREAYTLVQIKDVPWSYRQERDYRTLVAQYPNGLPKNKNRVQHNALDDCYNQIESLVFVLNNLRSYVSKQEY